MGVDGNFAGGFAQGTQPVLQGLRQDRRDAASRDFKERLIREDRTAQSNIRKENQKIQSKRHLTSSLFQLQDRKRKQNQFMLSQGLGRQLGEAQKAQQLREHNHIKLGMTLAKNELERTKLKTKLEAARASGIPLTPAQQKEQTDGAELFAKLQSANTQLLQQYNDIGEAITAGKIRNEGLQEQLMEAQKQSHSSTGFANMLQTAGGKALVAQSGLDDATIQELFGEIGESVGGAPSLSFFDNREAPTAKKDPFAQDKATIDRDESPLTTVAESVDAGRKIKEIQGSIPDDISAIQGITANDAARDPEGTEKAFATTAKLLKDKLRTNDTEPLTFGGQESASPTGSLSHALELVNTTKDASPEELQKAAQLIKTGGAATTGRQEQLRQALLVANSDTFKTKNRATAVLTPKEKETKRKTLLQVNQVIPKEFHFTDSMTSKEIAKRIAEWNKAGQPITDTFDKPNLVSPLNIQVGKSKSPSYTKEVIRRGFPQTNPFAINKESSGRKFGMDQLLHAARDRELKQRHSTFIESGLETIRRGQ